MILSFIVYTIFIRINALGAYLIFGVAGWTLIRGGRILNRGGCLVNAWPSGRALIRGRPL